jgi:AraC-like DNA-binding protein/mannose-6-phosphate isomerase-like protein (cupin superfamily)
MKIYKAEWYMQKGHSVGVFSKTSNFEPVHMHEFIEIIYAKSGSAVERIDDVDYHVKRGDMIFVNYGSTHSFSASDNEKYEYVNICFAPEVVADSIITPENAFSLLSLTAIDEINCEMVGAKLSFFGSERREIEDILDSMLREKEKNEQFSGEILESYLNILIKKMLRKTSAVPEQSKTDENWKDILDYIDDNLNTKMKLSGVAEKCFYNPSYFSRMFKEKSGVTLMKYIRERRISMSKKLLIESQITVDEISIKVGFSNRSSFYRFFPNYTAMTPSEYRKELKNKKQPRQSEGERDENVT